MNLDRLLLLLYVLAPFLAALFPARRVALNGLLSAGSVSSLARIVLLFALIPTVISQAGQVMISGTLVNGYPLEFVLSLDAHRFGFLLTAEFCFLLAHWMGAAPRPNATLVRALLSLAQGFSSLLILSDNSVATGALEMLAGAVFFYLVRFSLPGGDRDVGASISRRMYVLFFLLGILMISWGIIEFGLGDLRYAKGTGSTLGLVTWLVLLVLAVPLPPWARWFSQAVEELPEGVTLALVTFVSAVALKFSSLFSVVYPDLAWQEKLGLYLLGVVGGLFSLSRLFASDSRRKLLGSLPTFFFALILISVGVSKQSLSLSAYFVCLFVPVFTGLILYASAMKLGHPLQKAFVALLFAVTVGLPGTPVFMIFSRIGARSLDMGASYTLAFGVLWFLYFFANVFICRRLFMENPTPRSVAATQLDGASAAYAGYGLFLIIFVVVITQLAGRIL
jgi:hypothetical protein